MKFILPVSVRESVCMLLLAAGAFIPAQTSTAVVPWTNSINTNNIIVVTNATYGAKGDNATDNTTAIQNALNAVAKGGITNGLRGGTVEIPAGTNAYLCGPLNFSNNVNLQIDAGAVLRMLPYGTYPGYPYTNSAAVADFISGSSLTNIEISGSGAIDGQGAPWWQANNTNSSVNRPIMIAFGGCNRQLIQNVTLSNSPMFHLAIGSSGGNKTVQGVIIRAPSSSDPVTPSHNTDACDVGGTNILVQNCDISVGDDDFTCGGGTWDVLLTNNVYGTGHGVSIGSYTQGGVSNFLVINCTFNGTDNGIRLKSERGRGGLVQNLTYCNLTMTNVAWPLLVYSYYEFGLGTLTGVNPAFAANTAATNPTTLNSTTPIWRNITFSNITATAGPAGRPPLMVWGLPEALASNIVFRSVNITSASTLVPGVYNGTNIQFIDCNFNLPAGVNDMQFYNASLIFTNTYGTATTTNLWMFDGLTTNGYGTTLQFYNALGTLKNTNAFDDGPLTLAASTFTISNNLTLFPATVLNYTLSTNTTKLAVTGNLTLGGTNNISAGPGFTNGTFTLMTYGGTLSGSLPTLTAPAGFSYAYDTNTVGQVKLVTTATNQQPPVAPTGLTATASNALVSLTWSASAGATNYSVKRFTVSGGSYTVIGTAPATSYSDTQVTNGTTYYYVVSGLNAAGEGTNSAEVNATPIAVPTNLTATASNAQAVLNWNAAAGATSYNVKRATVSGGPYTTVTNVTTTGCTNTGLVNGATYYYVVSGVNTSGESSNSAEVSATPQAPAFTIITTNIFTDTFAASTLNGASVPSASSTSYDIASSKNATTGSSLTPGSYLRLGLNSATSSGFVEVQALFTTNPVTLATVGDCINFTYTFTNTMGTLLVGAASSSIFHGLYSSGGNAPVPGYLNNSGLTTNSPSIYGAGYCAGWNGYASLICSNGNAQIYTRPAQNTVLGTPTRNQDLIGNGFGSGTYTNTPGVVLGNEAIVLGLTSNGTYTASYSIALTAAGTMTITNNLYAGSGTGGTLIFSQTNSATGANYLTNSFDALCIAVRNAGTNGNTSGYNPVMDISKIAITATLTVSNNITLALPAAPAGLTANATNLLVDLKWNAVSGATNYNLKRGAASAGPWTTNFSVATTNYADAAVSNAVNYYYVVTAQAAGGESTNSSPANAIPLPSNQPTNITALVAGSQLQLSWPQDHLGWRLLIQTNNLATGLSTNWATVPNSTNVMATNIPIVSTNGSVFLRLVYP